MAYNTGGIIENTDYNDIMINPADAANRLNAIWGVGKGSRGYGQPGTYVTVEKGEIVTANQWNNIISATRSFAQRHDNPIASSITNVVSGEPVNYDNGIVRTNIESIDATRTWCRVPGPTFSLTRQNQFIWRNQLRYTVNVFFGSGDQTRYFWNCGGQISINVSQPSAPGRPITQMISDLASAMGTVYWTAIPGPGKKTKLVGTEFDAVTKIGGSGTPETIAKDIDYYNSSLYNSVNGVLLFQQKATNAVPAYSNSNIRITASTSGVKGANEDNGNSLVLQVILDTVPDGAEMPALGSITVYVSPPALEPSNLTKLSRVTWTSPAISITATAI
jgi:hypothetical protein